MICTNCGKELQDGETFCPYCGALFSRGLSSIHYDPQPVPSRDALPVYSAEALRAAWEQEAERGFAEAEANADGAASMASGEALTSEGDADAAASEEDAAASDAQELYDETFDDEGTVTEEDEARLDALYRKALQFEEEERRRREEEERRAREEAARKAEEERKAREEAERRAREEAERRAEEERKAREKEERRVKAEAEARAEAERIAREEEEARRKAEEEACAEAERQAQREAEAQAQKDAERAELEEAMKQELLHLAAHKTLGTHMFDEEDGESEEEDAVEEAPADETGETEAEEQADEAKAVSEAKSEEAHTVVESETSSSGSAEEASEEEPDSTEETSEAAETEEVAEATEDTETDAAVPEGPEADEAAESSDDTPAEESEETETEEKAVGEPEDSETETSAEIITLAERQRTADDAESEAEDFDDVEADEWDDDAAEDVAEELPSEEAPDADAAEDAASEEPEAEVIILQADSEESVRKHRKLPYIAAGLAVLLIVAAAIAWYFMPSSREARTLRKAEAAYAASDYADAAALYQELMNYGGQTAEVCLHAADAYANAGRHAEAVALLGHALASDPDNTALQALLEDLNPTVEFSPEGGDFTDPVSVTMTADDHDIRYTLHRDGDSDAAAEITYATPAELRYSGSYTLTARGIGRDGEAGDAFTQQYVVKLDPEKYHLNDWMETEQGVQYLDETGRCVTGWQTIDGKKYYFDSDGYRVTGMTETDRDTYFFDADGVMQTGWQQDGTDWYFFDETGKLQRDVWIEETFYVDADGRMLTNATTPDGVKVGADGRRASDLATVFSEFPDAMVVIYSKERKNEGDYSTFTGKLYHQHSSDKPEGDSTDITVRVSNKAWVHYLDRTSLPDVLVTDAYQFLPYLGILNPTIDENGVITAFDFILGSQG